LLLTTTVVAMGLLQLLRVAICWRGTDGNDDDDEEGNDKSAGEAAAVGMDVRSR